MLRLFVKNRYLLGVVERERQSAAEERIVAASSAVADSSRPAAFAADTAGHRIVDVEGTAVDIPLAVADSLVDPSAAVDSLAAPSEHILVAEESLAVDNLAFRIVAAENLELQTVVVDSPAFPEGSVDSQACLDLDKLLDSDLAETKNQCLNFNLINDD